MSATLHGRRRYLFMLGHMRGYTSVHIARLLDNDEGREGISPFLEKRKPWWQAE